MTQKSAVETMGNLLQRIEQLEAKTEWMQRALDACGIRGLWFSPAKAAELLGISRSRIMAEIEMAEQRRAIGKPSDAVYGVHYRNVQDPVNSTQATWQVHLSEFEKLLSIPPDERKVG